jgi:hypothetical protein
MTTFWVKSMNLKKLLIAFLFSIAAVGANAAGCMKGAAVGAVARGVGSNWRVYRWPAYGQQEGEGGCCIERRAGCP